MKILITGAHFTPAQATIEALKRLSKAEIVYIGRFYTREGDKNPSAESQILPKMGVKFLSITTGRLQRTFTIYTLVSLLKIPVGFIQAFYLLITQRPTVVLSFGGYVAVPTVIAAWILSIPVIIHEQTLLPGLANQISGFFATKIAVSFAHKISYPKEKVVITGNPLRKQLTDNELIPNAEVLRLVSIARKKKLPLILITGGNQGAHFINELVLKTLDKLLKKACLIHQTGNSKFNDYERIQKGLPQLKGNENYLSRIFFTAKEMGYIYRNADLAITRGGVNTLLELSYFGVPTVIIPIPNHQEQFENARFFKSIGLSQTLNQSDLNEKCFLALLTSMLSNITEIKKRAMNASSVVLTDAADRLALETLLLG